MSKPTKEGKEEAFSIRGARANARKAFKEAIAKAEMRGYKRGIAAGMSIIK